MATTTEVMEGVPSEKSPVISSDKSPKSSHRSASSGSPLRKRPRLDDAPKMTATRGSESVQEDTGNDDKDSKSHSTSVQSNPCSDKSATISDGYEIDNSVEFFLSLMKSDPDDFKFDNSSRFVNYAELVLAHYKKKTDLDYELTCEKSMSPFPFPCGYKGVHLNFFARPKESESSPDELFYAEIDLRHDKVYHCCTLAPNRRRPDEPLVIEFIKHPPDVDCKGCRAGNHGAGDWEEVVEDVAEYPSDFRYYRC